MPERAKMQTKDHYGATILSMVALTLLLVGCGDNTSKVESLPPLVDIPFDVDNFQPKTVIPNAFDAIVKPKAVSCEEAAQTLQPEELVLGIEVNGEARAYPINMLTGPQREIINDELGGESIAATW